MELPYRNNERFISCIEEGEYTLTKYNSNRFKNCFKINDVKDRSDILIHVGNTSDCVLIGNSIIKDDDIIRLSDTRKALSRLNETINSTIKQELKIITE